MQAFLYNLRQFVGRLSWQQRGAIAAVLFGAVALLGGVAYWAGRPEYALLFGGLEPSEASRVVESLREQSIDYELKENGSAIFVPRGEVYELRLRFAGEGVVAGGPAGYELFDQGTLGMTDFMQKLNMKRALEGELARTISSMRQVDVCRVHLVVPERSPFRESQSRPSASVVLQVAGGTRLADAQIEGIIQLVAGAVEELDPADVTVLDARGNLLSDPDAHNPDLAVSSNQLRMQHAVEARLTEKGQSMLDQVLGPGNAILRVAATLDFTQSVSERELIDPESATVISEERLEEGGAGAALTANSAVRNYEVSRTRERSEKSMGEIEGLSVSVILNYKKVLPDSLSDDLSAVAYEPYAEAELSELEGLVKNAVGFRDERGDRFALHQTRFDTTSDAETAAELRRRQQQEQIQLYIRYGLMALALVLALLLLRSASRRLTTLAEEPSTLLAPDITPTLGAAEGTAAPALEGAAAPTLASPPEAPRRLAAPEDDEIVFVDDIYASKLSPEAKKRLKAKHLMFEEIKEQVTARPDDAAELIRTWIVEDLRNEPAPAL